MAASGKQGSLIVCFSADYLLGRRYVVLLDDERHPDGEITIIGVDPEGERIRAVGSDGSRAWFPFSTIRRLIDGGRLIESDRRQISA